MPPLPPLRFALGRALPPSVIAEVGDSVRFAHAGKTPALFAFFGFARDNFFSFKYKNEGKESWLVL